MKHWRDSRGKRWYTSAHFRATRLFRHHVNRPGNPRGRIHRELCAFCKIDEQLTPSQFHHTDYAMPFRGVWVCVSHHRKIELGTVAIQKRMIHDYTQLVAPLLKPKMMMAMRNFHKQRRLAPTGTDTPF